MGGELKWSDLDTILGDRLKAKAKQLHHMLDSVSDHWGYEDAIYRFYHQSFKVFRLQKETLKIVELLQSLMPEARLHPFFVAIIDSGTGKKFSPEANANWLAETRPIAEAFMHARYFLEMACRYTNFDPDGVRAQPSGWAVLLSLYRWP